MLRTSGRRSGRFSRTLPHSPWMMRKNPPTGSMTAAATSRAIRPSVAVVSSTSVARRCWISPITMPPIVVEK